MDDGLQRDSRSQAMLKTRAEKIPGRSPRALSARRQSGLDFEYPYLAISLPARPPRRYDMHQL